MKLMIKTNVTFPAAINVMYNRSSDCYQYRLIIYNAKLANLLLGKKEKAKLIKKEGEFYLVKDSFGNILNPSPKHQTVFMSIRNMLMEMGENLDLGNVQKSTTIKIKINLDPSEWGLTKLDVFLESQEERELAEKLILHGSEVRTITYNDPDKLINGCADLLLVASSMKIPIEITTTAPSESLALSGINSPHGHQWAKITVRILPLLMYTAENKVPSFFIMNKAWEKYSHVTYFKNKLEKFKCYVIPSDFATGWADQVANKILELSKK